MPNIAGIVAGLALTPFAIGAAQQTAFVGTVTDSLTRDPLPGVSVVLVEREHVTSTNAEGYFYIAGIETGVHTVLVRFPGYEPWAVRINVRVAEPIEVDIGPVVLTPVEILLLDPVTIEGETVKGGLAGFTRRMRSEKGTFITADDIERLRPRRTSDLLRMVHGFKVNRAGDVASLRGIPSLLEGFNSCPVEYYIDGVHSGMESMDNIIPTAIAGIEIYRGPSTTPAIFLGTGNRKCGVIAIWTKHGSRRRR